MKTAPANLEHTLYLIFVLGMISLLTALIIYTCPIFNQLLLEFDAWWTEVHRAAAEPNVFYEYGPGGFPK